MLPGNTKLSQIPDAEGQWRMQIQRDVYKLNANPYLINIRNGLYNVLENTLTAHSPEYLSAVQLNVNYLPGAECPVFLKFLHDALSDDQVYLVQEMLGHFLIPVNRAQKSFLIVCEAGIRSRSSRMQDYYSPATKSPRITVTNPKNSTEC